METVNSGDTRRWLRSFADPQRHVHEKAAVQVMEYTVGGGDEPVTGPPREGIHLCLLSGLSSSRSVCPAAPTGLPGGLCRPGSRARRCQGCAVRFPLSRRPERRNRRRSVNVRCSTELCQSSNCKDHLYALTLCVVVHLVTPVLSIVPLASTWVTMAIMSEIASPPG